MFFRCSKLASPPKPYRSGGCSQYGPRLLRITLALLINTLSKTSFASPPAEIELRIAIDRNIVIHHPELMRGDICELLDRYQAPLKRPPLDLILICKSLRASPHTFRITLLDSPNYWRSLRLVEKGLAHTMAESIWFSDGNEKLTYKTEAVLPIGGFEKGLYTVAGHPLLKNKHAVKHLHRYTGVTLKMWRHDWQIINTLSPDIVSTAHYESLIKMLDAGRGDFTLHEFPQGDDLSIEPHGVKLKPIPGIKVIVYESRTLVISKKAENAKIIAKILMDGIRALNKSGETKVLYSKLGFYNSFTRNWKSVNITSPPIDNVNPYLSTEKYRALY